MIGQMLADGLTALQFPVRSPRPAPREETREQAAISRTLVDTKLGFFGTENPEQLVQSFGLQLYDEMRLDDALGTYVDIKKTARLSTDWEIVPASDKPDDVERAEFVEYVIERMIGSLKEKMRGILTAVDYGYSITNKPLVRYDSGPFADRIGYGTLKTKEPHRFRFKLDKFRNIQKVVQETDDGDFIQLDPRLFIIYTYRKEFENPYGRSDFVRAFRWWNSKKWVAKFWDIYLERFAGGFLDISYDDARKDSATHAQMKKLVTDISGGRTGALHRKDYEINLVETNGRGNDVFKAAINERDIAMARAVLIPDLLGFSQRPGGAFALGKKHFDIFMQVTEELGTDLEETVMLEQFIRPMIDLNWAGVETYPRFRFKPFSKEQVIAIVTAMATLTEKGLLTPDDEIEKRVREWFDLPERVEIDEPNPQPRETPEKGPAETPKSDDEMREREERRFISAWEKALAAQERDLVRFIENNRVVEEGKSAEVDRISLRQKSYMRQALERLMLSSLYRGALDGQGVRTRSGVGVASLSGAPGSDVRAYFERAGLVPTREVAVAADLMTAEAFWITSVVAEQITSRAKTALFEGCRKGDAAWTREELRRTFSDLRARGVGVNGHAESFAAIARANAMAAEIEGRRAGLGESETTAGAGKEAPLALSETQLNLIEKNRENVSALLATLADKERVVIAGGPRSGKSTLAVRAGERFDRRVRHADALLGKLEWSEMSDEVASWLSEGGSWIVEGVVAVRAIRKWLAKNDGPVPFTVLWLDGPVQARSTGQERMAKGTATIWNEIEQRLSERKAGVVIASGGAGT